MPSAQADQRPAGRRIAASWDASAWAATTVIVAGLVYRVILVALGAPPTNSDEATMGLAALHISQGREFPTFFYGQSYMGTIEAYLAAPLFWLFGPSTTALRVPLLLFFAVFGIGGYLLTRLLFDRWLAVVVATVLALGADRIVKNQLIAAGGYPEISPGAVLLLLVAVLVGLRLLRPGRRVLAFWGVVAGLLFWTHWLIMPYLVATVVVLVAALRAWPRSARPRWAPGILTTGFVVGSLPLVLHNLTAPISQNSVVVFLGQSGSGATSPVGEHLHGGVLLGVPLGVGLCSPSDCAPWQLFWAVPYLLLLVTAGVLAARRLAAPGTDRFREVTRLALVLAAGLSILAYARSSAAADTPVESARYLSPLLISTPVVLWPLWLAAGALRSRLERLHADRPVRLPRLRAATSYAPLGALLGTMLVATVASVAQVPTIRQEERRRDALAVTLLDRGITRIYSDYWTCNRATFATRERVVCAVLADDLRPGHDRYAPYRNQVASAERPAYVVPGVLPALDDRIRAWLDTSGVPYEVWSVAEHRIYLPSRAAPLPGTS